MIRSSTSRSIALLLATLSATAARAADKKPAVVLPSMEGYTIPLATRSVDTKEKGKDVYAVFETSRGKIGVKLLPGESPKTVANFVELATGKKPYKDPVTGESKKGSYFDGTLFHRVIPSFMIQGGDPLTREQPLGASAAAGRPFGTSGPGYEFEDELPAPGNARFDKPCVLAMANHGKDTNGSQFFITEGYGQAVGQLEPHPCPGGAGVCGYTRFGQGVCGCELVGVIARAGNSQTRLVKVTITNTPPTCK